MLPNHLIVACRSGEHSHSKRSFCFASVIIFALVFWLAPIRLCCFQSFVACGAVMAQVSPHQYSSAVIEAPAEGVFELVKAMNFKWLHTVSKVEKDSSSDTINICYSDNTIQKIRQLGYSALDMSVTWEVIESEPAAPTFSAVHTIQCHRITTSSQCFLSWTTDFSSDCTVAVVEDAKWKKTDAFQQLQDFLGGRPGKRTGGSGGEPPAKSAKA